MLGVVILVILASASITNAHYTSSSEYARQCGSDTYLPWSVNNETAYVLFETWSRVECAVRCSTLATCEGYNICPNSSSFYNCEIIDSIRDDFVCSMTESRVNCSVYIKESNINPLAYLTQAAVSLTAGCPAQSYLLPEYHICYWKYDSTKSNENLTACDGSGGYLAVIPSTFVMDKLEQHIDADSTWRRSDYYWIDVNDLEEEDVYVNQFGPITWTSWDGGQPNDDSMNEDQDCTIMCSQYSGRDWHDRNCMATLSYYPLCFNYIRGDGFRKRYVVNGATNRTYGNLTDMVSDIDMGVAVRILVNGILDHNILVNADAIFKYPEVENKRCAQSVHHTQLGLGQGVVIRVIRTLCTTGELELKYWGENSIVSTVTYLPEMVWFTSDRPTAQVKTPGQFLSDVESGSDLVIQVGNERYPMHDVYGVGHMMKGQFSWRAHDALWTSTMLENENSHYLVDWNISDSGQVFLQVNGTVQIYRDEAWQHVYTNDENGVAVYGNNFDFVNYINGGHEVKVSVNGRVSKADIIYINGLKIDAILSLELKTADLVNDLHKTVTIVSTSGQIKTYTFGFSNNTSIAENISACIVRWYVDVSMWTEVLRTDKATATSYDGILHLHEVFIAGQPIRLKIKTILSEVMLTLDSTVYYPGTQIFEGAFCRGFDIGISGDGSLEMNYPVQTLLVDVSTNGNYARTTVPNGSIVRNETIYTLSTMTWFSNPYVF